MSLSTVIKNLDITEHRWATSRIYFIPGPSIRATKSHGLTESPQAFRLSE